MTHAKRPAMSLAFLLVASGASNLAVAQSNDDFDKRVRDACGNNPLIRLQAAKRVAKGGERAAAAVLRFAEKEGNNALSAELVVLLGRLDDAVLRTALASWVADANFAWRPQALLAIAERPKGDDQKLFESFLDHGSWQMRRGALTGIANLRISDAPRVLKKALNDPDRRVAVLAASLLLDFDKAKRSGETKASVPEFASAAVPVLVRGLDAEDSFFGDDFGRLARKESFDALRRLFEQDCGYRIDAPRAERRSAIVRFQKLAETLLDGAIEMPDPPTVHAWSLGFERRSCRDGDLVLRLDAQGRLWKGAFELTRIDIDDETRDELRRLAKGVEPPRKSTFGRIRCDLTRFAGLGAAGNIGLRAAPGSEPPSVQTLEKRLLELAR
ncbi:MAG: hypothetical protein H6834_07910 [Planctomycetes bacterium]|nr:hypothetical protein [Planctomycetota bacterium]